ncbi:hypothetical protein C7999DRAFT_14794 [Corynascus novoguineensis]|uniref:Uncharacterized protein n=1 Tax=Corynascus novoguineensis TaxID=1126955 RepID=A0AAN7CSM7_9PEZI|nr:hypothetical protein C7999DRAFT_14794 [Corynascus novoguineensis]
MAAIERNEVALRVEKWATAVRENQDIRNQVKEPGKLAQLAVSDCDFDNSASGITHTEYLHLRTVWYRYMRNHIDSFAGLLKDDKETGYKGFISPQADALATQLMARKSTFLSQYLEECQRTAGDVGYLHPSFQCGYYANVRYWQVMVTAHTKGNDAGGSKIFKPTVRSGNTRPVTPQQQQQHDVSVSPSQLSQSGSPLRFTTPAAKSHPPARGTSANSPSADEAYVNTALLLFLQAVTQDFHKHFPSLHWVPPRMAMHLKVPVENARTKKYEDSILLEARVDGYLCDAALEGGLSRPIVICEAKSALRSSIQVATERQEAAEMAAWICHDRGGHGLLQSSASGRKRRLMISQTRDEIWIIVGEYGHAYEEYIRNAPRRAGMSSTNAPPLRYTALASSFEETLGSPTFLDQLDKMKGAGDIQGWEDPVVQTALAERSGRKQAERSQRHNRTGGGPDLPKVDGFLVMHRFGPWKTHDPANMDVFVRRLLGLMIQLHSAPSRQLSSRASK